MDDAFVRTYAHNTKRTYCVLSMVFKTGNGCDARCVTDKYNNILLGPYEWQLYRIKIKCRRDVFVERSVFFFFFCKQYNYTILRVVGRNAYYNIYVYKYRSNILNCITHLAHAPGTFQWQRRNRVWYYDCETTIRVVCDRREGEGFRRRLNQQNWSGNDRKGARRSKVLAWEKDGQQTYRFDRLWGTIDEMDVWRVGPAGIGLSSPEEEAKKMKNSCGPLLPYTTPKNPGLRGWPIAVLVEWKTPPNGVFGDEIKYKITLYIMARTDVSDRRCSTYFLAAVSPQVCFPVILASLNIR